MRETDPPAGQGPRLSIVIPMFNEEHNVAHLLERLFAVLRQLGEPFEVICVDDGSVDATFRLLGDEAGRRPELRALRLARNFGQHAAILAGFDSSLGEWVVTMDGDLQNPPEEIPRILAELQNGHDLVGTYRVGRRDSGFRLAASWLVNRIARRLSKMEIQDFGCMLRGYSGPVARAIAGLRQRRSFIPALGTFIALNPVEIPIAHAPRAAGKSRYTFVRLVGLTVDLVICLPIFSRQPPALPGKHVVGSLRPPGKRPPYVILAGVAGHRPIAAERRLRASLPVTGGRGLPP